MSAFEQRVLFVLLGVWASVFISVLGVMVHSIVRRRNSGYVGRPDLRESAAVEILWALVPFVIVAVVALLAVRAHQA